METVCLRDRYEVFIPVEKNTIIVKLINRKESILPSHQRQILHYICGRDRISLPQFKFENDHCEKDFRLHFPLIFSIIEISQNNEKNPFCGLIDVYEMAENLSGCSLGAFIKDILEFMKKEPVEKRRIVQQKFHSIKESTSLLYWQFVELAEFFMERNKQYADQNQTTKVLWIENKPQETLIAGNSENKNISLKDMAKFLERSFGFDFDIISREEDFSELLEYLNKKERELGKSEQNLEFKLTKENRSINIAEYQLFLLDLYLDYNQRFNGGNFIRPLEFLCPSVPVFILSKTWDFDEVRSLYAKKVDVFIHKSQFFKLPVFFSHYYIALGSALNLIKEDKLKNEIAGAVRYYTKNPDFLWLGDKCYFMVDHSFRHARNVWDLLNRYIFQFHELEPDEFGDDDIYSMMIAAWLHDIGHSGNEEYGQPHKIRKLHGIFSAFKYLSNMDEIISLPVKSPNLIGHIDGVFSLMSSVLSSYKNMIESTNSDTVRAYQRQIGIILNCAYHQSSCPLHRDQKLYFDKIPKPFKVDNKPIYLSDHFKKQFLKQVLILRMIDCIDFRSNRVGNIRKKIYRLSTIKTDLKYHLKMYNKKIEGLKSILNEELFQKIKINPSNVEDVGFVALIDQCDEELCRYFNTDWVEELHTLLDYIKLLYQQNCFFRKHESIQDVDIILDRANKDNKIDFIIQYSTTNLSDKRIQKEIEDYITTEMNCFKQFYPNYDSIFNNTIQVKFDAANN